MLLLWKLFEELILCSLGITLSCSSLDSKLKNICTKSLSYSGHSLEEPFGCLPTTSIVIQVICVYLESVSIVSVYRTLHAYRSTFLKL